MQHATIQVVSIGRSTCRCEHHIPTSFEFSCEAVKWHLTWLDKKLKWL